MGNKTYQQWCIDALVRILNERSNYRIVHGDQGYKYVLKAIISHYASMYYVGDGIVSKRKNGLCRNHLNIWWDHLNKYNAHYFFNSLVMSKEAHKIYNESSRPTEKSFSEQKGELKHKLHIEHIMPAEYIYEKLENLPEICGASVKRCFDQNKLILITKEERNILDGKGSRFEEKDLMFLQEHFSQLRQQYWQEFKQVEKHTPKSHGLGLLRMARLYNSGVRFVYGATGKVVPISEWMKYLNDHDNIINVK